MFLLSNCNGRANIFDVLEHEYRILLGIFKLLKQEEGFIGKVSASGVAPSTPNSGVPPVPPLPNLDDGQAQVSPMSSAFPPVQPR